MHLATSRLLIRPFNQDDLDVLAVLMSCPEVMAFSPLGPLDRDASSSRLQQWQTCLTQNGFSKYALFHRESQDFIGYCGAEWFEHPDYSGPEFGYRIAAAYWGKGYAFEAAQAVTDYLFQHQKLPSLLGLVQPANQASVAILKKLDMQRIGAITQHGRPVDVYQLTRAIGKLGCVV